MGAEQRQVERDSIVGEALMVCAGLIDAMLRMWYFTEKLSSGMRCP
jgi:hypothetical protein